jgi:pimeloyl-ACP methyl ester carboxylesterase
MYRDITQVQWDGQYSNAYAIGQQGTEVQLVWGLYDSVVYVYCAQYWTHTIPQAKLTTLETSCHTPHLVDGYLPYLTDVILPDYASQEQ